MPVSPATLDRQCAQQRTVIHLEAHRPVVMHVEPYAPPTVESIQEGQRRLAACTQDACAQGRKRCPTPDACRVPDPMPGWTPLTASESFRFWLAVLGIPGCVLLIALAAVFWPR